jgi:hypothetical protein
MKEGSVQVPTFYLGAKLNKTVLPNDMVAWGMISSNFVQSAIQNVQEYLAELPGDQKLKKKAAGPFTGGEAMIPFDAPVPDGKEVDLRLFVDSDHAGEKFTRRLRTGFVIYLNMAPIVWFSKHQPTVESSVFLAEFVAIKNGIKTYRGLGSWYWFLVGSFF